MQVCSWCALQFEVLAGGTGRGFGIEPGHEAGVKKAGFSSAGFARIDEPDEEKADVAVSGRGFVSKLHRANRIDLADDWKGIAPVGDGARERIVDAEDFLADGPCSVG